MTFDSCQGEKRGIIFYSLVASQHNDRLSWIFPVSLDHADADVQDKLRMQRLNVGFSRAGERICFVLSKPIEEYRGSMGRVLYRSILLTKGIATANRTDKTSPMERQVLEWLKATRLFQMHGPSIELIAQFPVRDVPTVMKQVLQMESIVPFGLVRWAYGWDVFICPIFLGGT